MARSPKLVRGLLRPQPHLGSSASTANPPSAPASRTGIGSTYPGLRPPNPGPLAVASGLCRRPFAGRRAGRIAAIREPAPSASWSLRRRPPRPRLGGGTASAPRGRRPRGPCPRRSAGDISRALSCAARTCPSATRCRSRARQPGWPASRTRSRPVDRPRRTRSAPPDRAHADDAPPWRARA